MEIAEEKRENGSAVLPFVRDADLNMDGTMIHDFTAIDVETTGLNPKTEKIIEVGAVRVRNGKIVDRYESLINPGRRLEEKIVELTGITDEMVKAAPMAEEVMPQLLSFMGEDILLGHSLNFDYSFIKRLAVNLRLWNTQSTSMGIDTLKIARYFLKDLESRSLPFLCQYFEIPHKAHRALEDAKAAAMLYKMLAERFNEENIFLPYQLIYQVKREAPATAAQKERLYKLAQAHKLILDYDINMLTRNEASRMADKIVLEYGRYGQK